MATKSVSWNTGNGNITLTYQGQGDGTITVASDQNDLGTARSQTITIETTKGGLKTKNLTITQGACPVPVGTILNYSYTGSYQEVTLPAGKYKLQCWGAQGGSNAAASSYNITAKAGGKGGYSEGIITLSSKTTVRVYVGGQGSSSAGGFNGGGSTSGSASYSSGNTYGTSRMGGGGGATDIRLSDGALLSRMIVAGGGSGGAYTYREEADTTQTTTVTDYITDWEQGDITRGQNTDSSVHVRSSSQYTDFEPGKASLYVTLGGNIAYVSAYNYFADGSTSFNGWTRGYSNWTLDDPNRIGLRLLFKKEDGSAITPSEVAANVTAYIQKQVEVTIPGDTSASSSYGYVGGGTSGGGYSSTYQGRQNAAGTNGAFGLGANQTTTNYRHCSGAGGGGWYGGGMNYSDSDMNACKMSGGGSGFVNTSANASYRPSGYTGLQLDSGTTYAGNQSFPNASGTGNETGHSGNGYAKITRLA